MTDSLEQVLASGTLNHYEKANLLKNLANAYLYVDTAKGRMHAFEAIKEAQNIGSKKIEASAYIALANIYQMYDTAKHRTYCMKALHTSQNVKGCELQEAIANLVTGIYYYYAYQYYKAHAHYKKAEKQFLELNDKTRLKVVTIDLLLLFCDIGDVDNEKYYANKLLELAIETDDLDREIFARFSLVWANHKYNPGQEALDAYLDLLQKSSVRDNQYTGSIATTAAITCLRLDRPREALQYLYRALEHHRSCGGGLIESQLFFNFAEAYAMLHQVDSATYYLKKTQDLQIIQDEIKVNLYRIRSMLHSVKGDHKGALEIYKKYHHLSDSLSKAWKTTETARMKNWHELEQKDNENYLLQQEHQKQDRLIRFLTVALLMIIVLLALSVILYRKTADKNRELKQLHTVKDKLFSVVAHDLRSPMGALMSMLNLANDEMIDAETQAQLLKDISARVDDTYSLLDNLLHWSRSQMQGMTPAPVVFDAQDGSRAVTDSLQSIAAHKNIILNNRIAKQQIYADRDMFAVVVRNLTMNAIKYTPEVGEITLASELKDNMLIISVKDNGTGMTQEVQDKLFKLSETRSKRGTNNESGTGLGLVLCADFVKINGGDIWFTSVQGEGSTFYFSIRINK